jgi:Bacterial membrane protein YfhO
MFKDPRERRFLFVALGLFLIVAVLEYAPVLAGRVPIPARLVTNFPAWHSTVPNLRVVHGVDYGDLITFFYPWRLLVTNIVYQHEVPQWNRHLLGGTPLIASAPGGIFYPIHALFFVLPIATAWSLKLILNVVLAGFLTAVLVKSLGADSFGSISAGVIYALCGFITGWQGQGIADAALWLPLICWSVHQIYKTPSLMPTVMGACAFGLPVLSGHPETAAHTTLVGLSFFSWQVLMGGWSRSSMLRRLAWFTVAALLAIGLSAIQILPTVEWLGQIKHSLDLDWGSLKSHELLAFFSRDVSSTPNSSNIYIPEKTAYAGVATLLLAAFALLHRSMRRHAVFFLLLVFFAIEVAAGWEPAHGLVSHIPVLKGIKNWRLLGVADFGLAVLAGLGISQLNERESRPTARVWILLGTVALAVSLGIWTLHTRLISEVSWSRGPAAAAALLVVGFGLVSLRLLRRIDARTFGPLMLLFLSFDLLTYAFGYLPFVRAEEIFPPASLFTFLQRHDPQNNRVVNLGAYSMNAEIVYGLESAGGYEVALTRVKDLLNDFAEPRLDAVQFESSKILQHRDRRLDLMNARYLVTNVYDKNGDLAAADPQRFQLVFTDGAVSVFENRRALPRAWFIAAGQGTIEVLPRQVDQFQRLRDPLFDPERSVILDRLPEELPHETYDAPVAKQIEVMRVEGDSNGLTLRVNTPHAGVVVVSQIFYPGWYASIDGVRTTLLRPDYAFIGATVPTGTHEVRFEFRPLSVRVGAALSLMSIFVLLGMCVVARIRARSAKGVPEEDEKQPALEVIGRAALRRPVIVVSIIAALLLLLFASSLQKPRHRAFDPAHPPQLLLSATEVRAGMDSYILTIKELPNTTVSIQYSIDNEVPQTFLVTLDSDGAALFEVGRDTRKGTYRILAFRESSDQSWIPADASIVVK